MEPFIGEIRMMGFGFAPTPGGWALCDGSLLPINQNQALFSLLGTYYGGDGTTTFRLPDLRGTVPVHIGSADGGVTSYQIGSKGGSETVTIDAANLPAHSHAMGVSTAAGSLPGPLNHILAGASNNIYGAPTGMIPINPNSVTATGGGLGHANIQPFTVANFCIAVRGIFPSRQ